MSLKKGIFPDSLKRAKVIPIYKKGKHDCLDNYRPISLLSNIGKVFEKVMYIRTMEYFNKHNFLFDNQFGFRANHSTTDALYSSVNMIKTESHNHNHVMGIFLDLSKAFDTVDHTILLHKLNHYGIRGNSYHWFQSYLSNRTQFTVIDGISSSHLPVSTGVP